MLSDICNIATVNLGWYRRSFRSLIWGDEESAVFYIIDNYIFIKLYEKELNDLIFRRIGNDSTLIIISHRLSIAKMADRVLVLDHGTIAEQGKHEELLANSDSLYQKLWNAQLSWYGE